MALYLFEFDHPGLKTFKTTGLVYFLKYIGYFIPELPGFMRSFTSIPSSKTIVGPRWPNE